MNPFRHSFHISSALVALSSLLVVPLLAQADAKHGRAVALLPSYQQECASCHVAYPPMLLPAASWQALMNNLPRHFGVDASVDAAMQKDLSAWLTANSSRQTGGRPPEDRISRSDWFIREHREIAGSTWKLTSVRSASNCAACHTTAEQGEFNERSIRTPR